MNHENIVDVIRGAIADEIRLVDIDFHRGRISAFQFVLSMLEPDKPQDEPEYTTNLSK